MQLVIDINDGEYKRWKSWGEIDALAVRDALVKAIPLPKGHGRLIDADELQKDMIKYGWKHSDSTVHEYVEDRPTIIEADKEVEGNADSD